MKKIIQYIALVAIFNTGANALAHGDHYAKHNMVLFGKAEIYVSHIVYKVPHNFQVILKLELDKKTKEKYLPELDSHPNDQFIFLLDNMDIKKIESASRISGAISRTDEQGKKVILAENVSLEKTQFKVIFFDELPLSLESNK